MYTFEVACARGWSARGILRSRPHGPRPCALPLSYGLMWSRRRDSNPRPRGPEPRALPACATPRWTSGRESDPVMRFRGPPPAIRRDRRERAGVLLELPSPRRWPGFERWISGRWSQASESNRTSRDYRSRALSHCASPGWSRVRESNPRLQLVGLANCHYSEPAMAPRAGLEPASSLSACAVNSRVACHSPTSEYGVGLPGRPLGIFGCQRAAKPFFPGPACFLVVDGPGRSSTAYPFRAADLRRTQYGPFGSLFSGYLVSGIWSRDFSTTRTRCRTFKRTSVVM